MRQLLPSASVLQNLTDFYNTVCQVLQCVTGIYNNVPKVLESVLQNVYIFLYYLHYYYQFI